MLFDTLFSGDSDRGGVFAFEIRRPLECTGKYDSSHFTEASRLCFEDSTTSKAASATQNAALVRDNAILGVHEVDVWIYKSGGDADKGGDSRRLAGRGRTMLKQGVDHEVNAKASTKGQ